MVDVQSRVGQYQPSSLASYLNCITDSGNSNLVVVTNGVLPDVLVPERDRISRLDCSKGPNVRAFLGTGVLALLFAQARQGDDTARCRAAYISGMASAGHRHAEVRLVLPEVTRSLGSTAFCGQYKEGSFPHGVLNHDGNKWVFGTEADEQAAMVKALDGGDNVLEPGKTAQIFALAVDAMDRQEVTKFLAAHLEPQLGD